MRPNARAARLRTNPSSRYEAVDDTRLLTTGHLMTDAPTDEERRQLLDCLFAVCCNHLQTPAFQDDRFIMSGGKPVSVKSVAHRPFPHFRVRSQSLTEDEMLRERLCHPDIQSDGDLCLLWQFLSFVLSLWVPIGAAHRRRRLP